jgi:hypothetical protein
MVWLVLLFFFLFFSSFFSLASLGRKGGKRLGEGKSRIKDFCRSTHEASRSTHPLLMGGAEGGGGGAEDSLADFLL